MTRFLESEPWRSMVQPSVVPALPDLSTLQPADLDDLLAVFEKGARGEEFASFILLRALSNRPGDFPAIVLEPQQRRRFLDAVQRKSIAFVRNSINYSEWLASVVTVQWCAHAPDAAFATLEDVDITRTGARTAGRSFPSCHTPRAAVSACGPLSRHSPVEPRPSQALSRKPWSRRVSCPKNACFSGAADGLSNGTPKRFNCCTTATSRTTESRCALRTFAASWATLRRRLS